MSASEASIILAILSLLFGFAGACMAGTADRNEVVTRRIGYGLLAVSGLFLAPALIRLWIAVIFGHSA